MSQLEMLQRPIYGGAFGDGRYSLATIPTIVNGLHAVRFMVVDPRGGAVLSIADEKLEALAMARRILHLAAPAANDARWQQTSFWPDLPVEPVPFVRPVSRRRREIFGRSDGRCRYCRTALVLEGPWHVEHMVPRALGGGDGAYNLVAACVRCNLAKSDCTALEFVAERRD